LSFNNPWADMGPYERRSVDNLDRSFACYWVTNENGKYGYLIESNEIFELPDKKNKLKGITVNFGNTETGSEFLMFLEEKENWQIFFALCNDLSKASENQESVNNFILAVQSRLSRWQKILQKDLKKPMTREMQMGLFTELACIKDFIEPAIGIKQALNSWVGPDSDKQDFLLDNFILEIKSFKTSKSPIASISSPGQLYSEKEPIYLVCFALTNSENGQSINDLIDEIKELIRNSNHTDQLNELFELKLDSCGYIPVFDEEIPLLSFIVDNVNTYAVNDDNFPKVTPQMIPSEISNLQYGIELTQCADFQVDIEEIFSRLTNG
jgi:hypothetical protein